MNSFLNSLALILAGISAVVAVVGIVRYTVTVYYDKKYWAKEMRAWKKSSRLSEHEAITKPQEWLKQHNDGSNHWDNRYPAFALRDFSDGVTLVVHR